jgi:predicted DNA-binding transcriptional regulator AlpA
MAADTLNQIQAYDIPQFCTSHNISRALFYKLLNEGKAPSLMKVGRRTLISVEAAAEWRRRMEAETAAA